MTHEQWLRLWSVYESALDLPEGERQRYLKLCNLEPDLARRVHDLLTNASAEDAPHAPLRDPGNVSLVGAELGRYRLTRELGRGGMGLVFAAQDMELHRPVALKFLAPWMATTDAHPFLREARAASVLNHPNIVTVYEVIQHGSATALVMELVEGSSFRELLAGNIEFSAVIGYARQIAAALQAAHAAGVVHRDIKPENIMVRPDGLVKVLDFGLARVSTSASSASVNRAVGTFRYMSPEQARGERAGPASDIFSLGIVLYEALAGTHPFGSETPLEALQAINASSPRALTKVSAKIPAALSDLIMAMLAKSAAARPSANEVAQTLSALDQGRQTTPDKSRLPDRRRALAAAVLGLSAGVFLVSRRWNYRNAPQRTILSRGNARDPVFSPDGAQIAFAWKRNPNEPFQIAQMSTGGGEPRVLTSGTTDATDPVWSPDGSRIAFFRRGSGEGAVFIRDLRDSTELRLDSSSFSPYSNMIDWARNGKALLRAEYLGGRPRQIVTTDLSTRETRPLSVPPDRGGDVSPRMSPDGRLVAFCRFFTQNTADLYVMSSDGGNDRRLTFDGTAKRELRWTPDGKSILFKSRMKGHWGLWCVPADGGDVSEVTLPRVPLGSFDVRADPAGGWSFVSADAFDVTSIWKASIPAAGAPPSTPERFISSQVTFTLDRVNTNPAVSPDGLYVAFVSTRSGSAEIWVTDIEGNMVNQRTSFGGASISQPSWSADGRTIVSATPVNGLNKLFVVDREKGEPRFLPQKDENQVEPQWSRDGKSIWFSSFEQGEYQTWRMPAAGGPAEQITRRESLVARESPDGNWIYFIGLRAGLWRVPRQGGEAELVLDRVTYELYRAWAIGREGLYYTLKDGRLGKWNVMLMNLRDRTERKICDFDFPPPRWTGALSLSPDERWLLLPQTEEEGSHLSVFRSVQI